MNVVRVCPVYFPYTTFGGSAVADYELDKALVREGHTVVVFTSRKKGDKEHRRVISARHEVRYFPVIGDIAHGFSLGALFRFCVELVKRGRETDFVWFGGVWNLLSVIGPALCRMCAVKYVITPHGMLIPRLIAQKTTRPKGLVIRWFLKSSLEKAHKVHFTVEKEFQETEQATQAVMNPVIFPLCFDLGKLDAGITGPRRVSDGDRIVLSFIGRITRKKRIDLVFEALKMLPSESKARLLFRIVGSDTEGLWDEAMYTEEEIGLPIQYVGLLDGAALVKAYDTADIFILCSESENFGIAVVEAAYCYTALFISKEVGVSEYFPETSAIYAEVRAADMCRKMDALINNTDKIYEYKMAARHVSERFESSHLPENYFEGLLG